VGKAYCHPAWTSEQQFYVTHHALDRLRERSEPAGHLDDNALCRVLDDATRNAMADSDNVFEVVDQDEEARLVRISGDALDGLLLSGQFFVLLKPNSREDSKRKLAVITVLTESMARKHYHIDCPSNGFGNPLADKLKGLNITPAPPKPKEPDPPLPAPEPEPEAEYLVICDRKVQQRGSKAAVAGYIAEHPEQECEVFRCYPVRVKVKVELED
jgi:hypothetical protein